GPVHGREAGSHAAPRGSGDRRSHHRELVRTCDNADRSHGRRRASRRRRRSQEGARLARGLVQRRRALAEPARGTHHLRLDDATHGNRARRPPTRAPAARGRDLAVRRRPDCRERRLVDHPRQADRDDAVSTRNGEGHGRGRTRLRRPARAHALAAIAIGLVLPGVAGARPSFVPSDPLATKQYYLTQDHAFDAFGDTLPVLNPVRVAIIDSGIDYTHPEFPHNRIWALRSFVGGSAMTDEQGHGTFIAGEIAAAINNNEGIAGIAFPAQLLIAKIAGPG